MYVAAAAVVICLLLALLLMTCCPGDVAPGSSPGQVIELPAPDTTGTMTLEQAIAQRRSKRSFTAQALTETQIGQLLWAAQATACLGQQSVQQAPASFVLTAVFARTRARYGQRADQYVHNEVGAAGENLGLQAVALGLGSVMVGAFNDEQITQVLSLPADHSPTLVIPVGYVP